MTIKNLKRALVKKIPEDVDRIVVQEDPCIFYFITSFYSLDLHEDLEKVKKGLKKKFKDLDFDFKVKSYSSTISHRVGILGTKEFVSFE